VLGPNPLEIKIPVNISTTPSGSNVNFTSCSTQASGAAPSGSALNLDPIANTSPSWNSMGAMSSSGGSGFSSNGSLNLNLSRHGKSNWSCGSLRTITVSHPDVDSSTRMVILSMYHEEFGSEREGFFRDYEEKGSYFKKQVFQL